MILGRSKSTSRTHRRIVDFSMQMTCRSGVFDTAITNVSETGLLIKTSAMLQIGEPIVLKRRGIQVSGEVVWVRGRRAGIRASFPIAVEALTAKSGLGEMKAESGPAVNSSRLWHWRRAK